VKLRQRENKTGERETTKKKGGEVRRPEKNDKVKEISKGGKRKKLTEKVGLNRHIETKGRKGSET
jgi:hypothetical protein